MGNDVPIPKSLPTAEIRKSDMGRTNPNYIAQFLLYQTKDVKDKAKEMLAAAKIKQTKMKETNEASRQPPLQTVHGRACGSGQSCRDQGLTRQSNLSILK